MKLLKFPITVEVEGTKYKVLFKPTGKPNVAKVIVTDVASKVTKYSEVDIPAEVPSWAVIAKVATREAFKEEINDTDDANDTDANLPASGASEAAGKIRNPERQHSASFLSAMQSAGIPTVEQLKKAPIIFAKDGKRDELYLTVPSSNALDRKQIYRARWGGPTRSPDYFFVHVYYPYPLKEWKQLEVKSTSQLRLFPEGAAKEKEMSKLEKKSEAKAATKGERKNVYAEWGKAFATHATKPNAPELIVKHMTSEFPDKKTKWGKWVNNVRALYNRGDKRLGVKAPAEKIAVYGGKSTPSKKTAPKKAAKKEKVAA